MGFNPRPRAGGDPTRGRRNYEGVAVSIHAPARGATRRGRGRGRRSRSFNPRPRAGGDEQQEGLRGMLATFQSTPPRGGRPRKAGVRSPAARGFNPRPRAGGDCGAGSCGAGWGCEVVSANLASEAPHRQWCTFENIGKILKIKDLPSSRTPWQKSGRLGFAVEGQTISGSRTEGLALAPWCSILPCQLLPRK